VPKCHSCEQSFPKSVFNNSDKCLSCRLYIIQAKEKKTPKGGLKFITPDKSGVVDFIKIPSENNSTGVELSPYTSYGIPSTNESRCIKCFSFILTETLFGGYCAFCNFFLSHAIHEKEDTYYEAYKGNEFCFIEGCNTKAYVTKVENFYVEEFTKCKRHTKTCLSHLLLITSYKENIQTTFEPEKEYFPNPSEFIRKVESD
jgi:hypothetical protein